MTSSNDSGEKMERIVVIGPTLLDYFHVGASHRLDQTAPVPRVDVNLEYCAPGGAANAALSVARLVSPVSLVTAVGAFPPMQTVLKTANVPHTFKLFEAKCDGYVAPQKHRVYAGHRLVARYDVEIGVPSGMDAAMQRALDECLEDCKPMAFLLSDYNKGVCSPELIRRVIDYANSEGIPVVVDPVPAHFDLYHGATIVCPNTLEACAVVPMQTPEQMVQDICTKFDVQQCVLTVGSHGVVLGDKDAATRIPAIPAIEVDQCGAGDAVAACLVCGAALGLSLGSSALLGIAAGSVAVEHPGCSHVYLYDVHSRRAKSSPMNKILDLDTAILLRESARMAGTPVAVANGVFDLLHPGHLSALQEAAAQAGFLIVLLNSDASASAIKRVPVQDEVTRATMLAALPCVDAVLIFDGDTPEPELLRLKPSVLVKGAQYEGTAVPGADILSEYGGVVHFAAHVPGKSTTASIMQVKTTPDDHEEGIEASATPGSIDAASISSD